jgi:hypothetical protein
LVNLSLLNTDWYAKGLKLVEPKVPITFSVTQIEALSPEMNPFQKPTSYTLPSAGITVIVPDRKELNVLRVQDKLVLNIVDANHWKKPIYFSTTVSDDNFVGLGPFLQMQGMVYKICPQMVSDEARFDLERTKFLLNQVYRFRTPKGKYIDETVKNLMTNYTACFLQTALVYRSSLARRRAEIDALQKASSTPPAPSANNKSAPPTISPAELAFKKQQLDSDVTTAVNLLDKCVDVVPWDQRSRMLRQEFLLNYGRTAMAEQRIKEALLVEPDNPEYIKMAAQVYEVEGKTEAAKSLMNNFSKEHEGR